MKTQERVAGLYAASEEAAVMFCGEDELPPVVREQPLPGGWYATGEVIDFAIGGEWREAWVLTRDPSR